VLSTKPYIIRAIYEWCADQGFTPYLTVVVDAHTRVPREYVREGQITLNIGSDATHQLMIGNEEITFQARFNGAAFPVVIPVDAVAAVFARENGQGMAFDVSERTAASAGDVAEAEAALPAEPTTEPEPPKRPHLTRIK
jgi:stringent starvation protein B